MASINPPKIARIRPGGGGVPVAGTEGFTTGASNRGTTPLHGSGLSRVADGYPLAHGWTELQPDAGGRLSLINGAGLPDELSAVYGRMSGLVLSEEAVDS